MHIRVCVRVRVYAYVVVCCCVGARNVLAWIGVMCFICVRLPFDRDQGRHCCLAIVELNKQRDESSIVYTDVHNYTYP